MSRQKPGGFWKDERGFTLPEVLITIILMGIVLAIATSSWNGVVESREVDSATNQLASDMRLAHTNATNRLANYSIVLTSGSPNYQVGPTGGTLAPRSLPEGTKLTTSLAAIEFRPDGSSDVGGSITIASDDGSPSHLITINSATSRIKID